MTFRSEQEVGNTRRKLAELERLIEDSRRAQGPGREIEIKSLVRLANQLREEIIRAHAEATVPKA